MSSRPPYPPSSNPFARTLLQAVFAFGCAILAVGCSGPGGATEPADPTVQASDVEHRLRAEYRQWEGTPHVLGGNSTRGLDCSAFVQRVFADAFDMGLPRTTESQVREGRRIGRSELQPGDLVFFRPAKTRHVGIYLSDGTFAHASSSEGVTISRMDTGYWRDAYWTSRRILPAASYEGNSVASRPTPERRTETVEKTSGARTGW